MQNEIVHLSRHLKKSAISRAYGSSGTILSLESIAGSYKPLANKHTPGFLGTNELETVISYLSGLPLEMRKQLPGLNPERADIIIAGGVILHEILKSSNLKGILTSSRSLRDGLLVDYISRIPGFPHAEYVSIRERSVRQLGKTCNIDEEHAQHIQTLCLQMFQSAKKTGLISYSDEIREILLCASYLHDAGQFISFSNHHQHSYYLITEISLLGFNQHETILIALIARYHRKKLPRSSDPGFKDLNRTDRRMVRVLSLFLRFAENLDRSHNRRVLKVKFSREKNNVVMKVNSVSDCSLEIWAAESDINSFHRTFRMPLRIELDTID